MEERDRLIGSVVTHANERGLVLLVLGPTPWSSDLVRALVLHDGSRGREPGFHRDYMVRWLEPLFP